MSKALDALPNSLSVLLEHVCNYATPLTFQQVIFQLKMTRQSVDFVAKMPSQCNSFVVSRFWQLVNAKSPTMNLYTIIKV
jgi:hypothetical protein